MIGDRNTFGFNGLYRLFQPHFQVRYNFSDHCYKRIKHMHVFKVALTHGLSESFLEEILPAKGFVWDFCGKRFDARLKYFKKLHNLMNLVVNEI